MVKRLHAEIKYQADSGNVVMASDYAALEARCRELEAALRNLNDTVKSMRNPQTLADVGLLLLKFNGPVFVADQLLGSGTETSVIKPAEITDENRCPRCGKAMMLPEYGCQACGWLLTASETKGDASA